MNRLLTLTISALFLLTGAVTLVPGPVRATEDFTLAQKIIEQVKTELANGNFSEAAKLTDKLSSLTKASSSLFRQKNREVERRADRKAHGLGRELEANDRRQAESQIKGAEQQKVVALRIAGEKNVTIPADILTKADDFLSRGKTALSVGNLRESERLARGAKNIFILARANIANLGKMRDDVEIEIEKHEIEIEMEDEFEDRINRREGEIRDQLDNKQTKVQAEIVGNVTRARVEVKFGTNATDRNVIAQEILNKMKLTRDDISRLLIIQNRFRISPEDLREKLEAKVRVSTVFGNVEAKLRFPLNTIDRAQIIDGIFVRTQALTAQDVLNVMEFRNDADKNNTIVIKGGEIKVTAETLATSALARVEVKFGSTIVDKNAIAQEIVNRMKLSRDEISRMLVIQPVAREDLKEKLEAKAVVKNNVSENEGKLRFPLNTVNRNQIIDGIFQRTQALSAQDVLSIIDFRTQ